MASARTAAVASLRADSATTVSATFSRRRDPTNSGMRIAGVGGREDGAHQQPLLEREPEGDRRGDPDDDRREHHTGDRQQPQADPHAAEDGEGEMQPTVEQDRRDAEREQDLRPRRAERDVHDVERLRAEQRTGADEQEHARHAQEVRGDAARQTGGEQHADGEDDVLGHVRVRRARRAGARHPLACGRRIWSAAR
jgi:hypothetical protein